MLEASLESDCWMQCSLLRAHDAHVLMYEEDKLDCAIGFQRVSVKE